MNLARAGFHVVKLEKFREFDERNLPFTPYETSMIGFLREIKHGKLHRFTIVNGLCDFLKSSTEEAIEEVRNILNKAIEDIISVGASIVFIVNCEIDNIPDNPSIYDKSLAMMFPRPHDIASMEPGYLFYPVI